MKELSIEEKAKAYDEAIKRAKKIHNEHRAQCADIMVKVFPELKESEDERIRKLITEFFKNYSENGTWKAIPDVTKWIAWLEAQGKNNMGISEATKKKLEDNLNKALEKETPESWNEFLDDKKPVDKVEPKFREGEWLCENEPNNYARFIQILEIVNVQGKYRYRISRDIHKDEDVVEFGFVEKYYHKFDITKDAKDGDVLACPVNGNCNEKIIFILRRLIDVDVECYCCIDAYGDFDSCINTSNIIGEIKDNDYTPATKEQRDQLEKAMAGAGYTFDFEKMELKKIEQKSTWSEEDKEMFGYALDMIEWYSGKNEDKSRAVSDWLKSLRP